MCFKKKNNNKLKTYMEEDRNIVWRNLTGYLNKESQIRSELYAKMMRKVQDFDIRFLSETIEKKYENKLNRRIRAAGEEFSLTKNQLLEKQKKNLKKLECLLAAEYDRYKELSQNRIVEALQRTLEEKTLIKDTDSESVTYSAQACLETDLTDLTLLRSEASNEENWLRLVEELVARYQVVIDIAIGNDDKKQNEYLLSMERLKIFRNNISKSVHERFHRDKKGWTRRRDRERAERLAVSLIDFLIREALPSPLPSRYSLSAVDIVCHNRLPNSLLSRHPSVRSKEVDLLPFIDSPKTTVNDFSLGLLPYSESEYKGVAEGCLDGEIKDKEIGAGMFSDRVRESLVDTIRREPALFDVLFRYT